MGIYNRHNNRSIPIVIPMPAVIRDVNLNTFRKGLRPLILQNVIHLPVDKDEIDDWCEICDKMINYHDEDPKIIDEFRNLLIETAYPTLEESTIMDKVDAKLNEFAERIDNLQSNFDKVSNEVKQLNVKVDELNKVEKTVQPVRDQDGLPAATNAGDHAKAEVSSISTACGPVAITETEIAQSVPSKTHEDTLAKVNLDLVHLTKKHKVTTAAIDRLDDKVDRLDTKVDRYDTKVDHIAFKLEDLVNQVKVQAEKLDSSEKDIQHIKKDIEKLEQEL